LSAFFSPYLAAENAELAETKNGIFSAELTFSAYNLIIPLTVHNYTKGKLFLNMQFEIL